jgi:uncharacterized protein
LSERGSVAGADASALAKLALAESETDARELGERGAREAAEVAAGLTVVPLSPRVADLARALDPPGLRALDAIHLASAALDPGLVGAFYCYDRRLCEAAAAAGLPVESPGA